MYASALMRLMWNCLSMAFQKDENKSIIYREESLRQIIRFLMKKEKLLQWLTMRQEKKYCVNADILLEIQLKL